MLLAKRGCALVQVFSVLKRRRQSSVQGKQLDLLLLRKKPAISLKTKLGPGSFHPVALKEP